MLPVMVVPRIPPLLMVLTPRAPIPALSPPPPRAEATVGDKASAIASAPAPARSLCCIDMLDSFIGLFRNSRVLIRPLCYFQLLATTAVPAREAMLIDDVCKTDCMKCKHAVSSPHIILSCDDSKEGLKSFANGQQCCT